MALSEKKQLQANRVLELSSVLEVEIIAHFYQRDEVKSLANFVGGSTGMINWARNSQAKALVVCGVSFIQETIARLRPDLALLVPRRDAGCPYSEAVGSLEVENVRRLHPKALVVADIKASGQVKDLADLLIPHEPDINFWADLAGRELVILPGSSRLEAGYFSAVYGWPQAVCQVHEQVDVCDFAEAKAEHPKALTVVNHLCRSEVRAMADFVGDSQSLWHFCSESQSEEFIVVCETGLVQSLSLAWPNRSFYETKREMFCPNMKLTNIKDILAVLENVQTSSGYLKSGHNILEATG